MLNREHGELLADLGPHFHVVPTRKWVDTPFWPAALDEALTSFRKTVARERVAQRLPIFEIATFAPENVLCQEYRTQGRLIFIFHARLGSKDFYHDVRIAFPRDAENQLVLIGRWKRESVQ